MTEEELQELESRAIEDCAALAPDTHYYAELVIKLIREIREARSNKE